MEDIIPFWITASGYVGFATIFVGVLPTIFPPFKWYLVLIAYVVAPTFEFFKSYGIGLTNWRLYSKDEEIERLKVENNSLWKKEVTKEEEVKGLIFENFSLQKEVEEMKKYLEILSLEHQKLTS